MNDDEHPSRAPRKRPATIVDVAEAAGVAIGTVSRHLNGLPIRYTNRQSIERAIAQLGYRRNSAAVAMKTDTTHVVGFLVPSLGEFHAHMLEHISREIRQTGRAVLTYCHDTEHDAMQAGLDFFASQRVDALVVNGDESMATILRQMTEAGTPLILYDNDILGLPAHRVFSDNRNVSFRLVSHLMDLGHERIAIIHGNLADSSARERLAGFEQALQARGHEPDPALVVDGQWRSAHGYDAMRRLMSLSNRPTAVFGASYTMTFGALSFARESGIKIPDDISVVSFDDVPAFRLFDPAITTVAQPIAKIAQTISRIINRHMSAPALDDFSHNVIECEILLRASTRRHG